MTSKERHEQFSKEWYDLRNRYLDYYIEFWSPDDVVWVISEEGGLPDGMKMDDVVLDVMHRIRTGHDAEGGVSWETLEFAYRNVLVTAKENEESV
jgi:hypothetical protein